VLKQFGDDPLHVYFICSGSITVYERTMAHDRSHHKPKPSGRKPGSPPVNLVSHLTHLNTNLTATGLDPDKDMVPINTYRVGQSVGDPEINYATPLSS